MTSLFNLGPDDIYPNVYECGPGRSLSAILQKVMRRKQRYYPFDKQISKNIMYYIKLSGYLFIHL